MGVFDGDPISRFCGLETETVQHIICCCEGMARQRYNVLGRPTGFSKGPLPFHTRHRVIEAVLNEILGLHNKPKAAVHSVHKLTGPRNKNKKVGIMLQWQETEIHSFGHPCKPHIYNTDFTFSEPCVVMHVCERDQQDAHLFFVIYFN